MSCKRAGRLFVVLLLAGLGIFFAGQSSCDKKSGGFNLFTIAQDKEFGARLAAQIESDPGTYPLVKRESMPEVYQKLELIRDKILSSGKLRLRNEFAWEVRVLDAPTLNAFCAPGGYIYFYTGLLKYLDTEAEVAGVMGHEMAHADCRHSTKQMTKSYGISTLLAVLVGDNANDMTKIAAQMASELTRLKFSRDDESEADRCAVSYLQETQYKPTGVAGFFEKLQSEKKGATVPEFLSTHPSDKTRIEAIYAECAKLDMSGKRDFEEEYKEFKEKYLK